MERYLQGSFIKYSSNAGYVNTKDYRATLQVERRAGGGGVGLMPVPV